MSEVRRKIDGDSHFMARTYRCFTFGFFDTTSRASNLRMFFHGGSDSYIGLEYEYFCAYFSAYHYIIFFYKIKVFYIHLGACSRDIVMSSLKRVIKFKDVLEARTILVSTFI